MAKHGKKYQEAVKLLDKTKAYSPQEAIELAKKMAQLDLTRLLSFTLEWA